MPGGHSSTPLITIGLVLSDVVQVVNIISLPFLPSKVAENLRIPGLVPCVTFFLRSRKDGCHPPSCMDSRARVWYYLSPQSQLPLPEDWIDEQPLQPGRVQV